MKYSILYSGRKIHRNVSADECADILYEYSCQHYEGDENIDLNLFEIIEENYLWHDVHH